MAARSEADTLLAGCRELGVVPPPGAVERLSTYLDLLEKWNRAYNLTAVRNRDEMVVRHLLDSLAILPHLQGQRFIDVGSGAGLPGVPLAICLPQKNFILLDSNGKKTRFLFQVQQTLLLENVEIADARVEAYIPGRPVDGVLSRAFASLVDMVTLCAHLTADGTTLYAMKGPALEPEINELHDTGAHISVKRLKIPGLGEQHSLVTIPAPQDRQPKVAART